MVNFIGIVKVSVDPVRPDQQVRVFTVSRLFIKLSSRRQADAPHETFVLLLFRREYLQDLQAQIDADAAFSHADEPVATKAPAWQGANS